MNPLEQIAKSALSGDALSTRSLLQDWMATNPRVSLIEKPQSENQTELALAAAFAELFSERLGQSPPAWAASTGPAPQPTHLLQAAITMRRLREMCEAESPPPLRRRQFFAPANYLDLR